MFRSITIRRLNIAGTTIDYKYYLQVPLNRAKTRNITSHEYWMILLWFLNTLGKFFCTTNFKHLATKNIRLNVVRQYFFFFFYDTVQLIYIFIVDIAENTICFTSLCTHMNSHLRLYRIFSQTLIAYRSFATTKRLSVHGFIKYRQFLLCIDTDNHK